MIQIATVLPAVSVGPVPPIVRVAESGASSFAVALGALLVPGAKAAVAPDEAAAPDIAVPGLQVTAEPGKELPEVGPEFAEEESATPSDSEAGEDAPAEQDPAFAWFALPAAPVTDQPPVAIVVALAKAVRVDAPEISAPPPRTAKPATPQAVAAAPAVPSAPVEADAVAPQPAAPAVVQSGSPLAARSDRNSAPIHRAMANPTPEAAAGPAPAPVPTAPPPPPVAATQPSPAPVPSSAATAATAPVETRATAAAQEPRDAPRAQASVPNAAAPAPPRSAVASAPEIARAPALAAAAPAAPPIVLAPLRRAAPLEFDQPVTLVAAPGAAALPLVAAAPETQQGALDMRRQEWIGQMVERIETLRDAAPIRETRIALLPDALGKVEIAVRHDGERVHVHFTAETQAARQILSDAQPRLTELAESRGVRLGQTSVDSGQAGANPHSGARHDGQRPQTPSAPPRARAETEFTATEERVA